MSRPFGALPFNDSFVVSPLNTVAKCDSNEQTVIVDLSCSRGSLVNGGIPSGYFIGEILELSYHTINAIDCFARSRLHAIRAQSAESAPPTHHRST